MDIFRARSTLTTVRPSREEAVEPAHQDGVSVANERVVPSFHQTVADLLRARFPCLYVQTWEEERLLGDLWRIAQDETLVKRRRDVFTWSLTDGMVPAGQLPERQERPRASVDRSEPLRALDEVERGDRPAIYLLLDFHHFLGAHGQRPDPVIVRRIRNLGSRLKAAEHPKTVIFAAPQLVLPADLQKDVHLVDFPLPSQRELEAVLDRLIADNEGRVVVDLTPEDKELLVKASLGLTLQEAENAFARSMANDKRLDADDIALVLDEKRQAIRKTEILEYVVDGQSFDDLGGLRNMKTWLDKRNRSWLDAAKRYALPPPKGILVTGVPGCGKSLAAKCMSTSWQLPLLRMDVGRIFSGIVGSSEQNMRTALRTAEATAPCILWIDEIEKGFGGGRGTELDGGTSSRVFGSFLTWMQEKAAPVFVIATANRIDQLPPEFLRKGRFDEIFFVDLPTEVERQQIFSIHLHARLQDALVRGDLVLDDVALLGRLAKESEGFSGAEIEQAVVSALFEAFADQRPVMADDLSKAMRNTVPLSVTQAEQVRALREWANLRAVLATPSEDRVGYQQEDARGDAQGVRGGRTIDF
jgi:SpoVK/Ycf46/Vps4 family AAA+-type ATPase